MIYIYFFLFERNNYFRFCGDFGIDDDVSLLTLSPNSGPKRMIPDGDLLDDERLAFYCLNLSSYVESVVISF